MTDILQLPGWEATGTRTELAMSIIDIVRSGGVVYLVAGTTKNGEPRMVPVHPDAVADLKHLPFTLHWRTYSRDFDQARVAVGLPHIRLHDLRHSVVRPGLARQARQGGDS